MNAHKGIRGGWKLGRAVVFAAIAASIFFAVTLLESRDAAALSAAVDSWVLSGQTVTVEGQSFTVYLSSRTNEVLADYGAGSLFVKNNSCEQTTTARICLDNIQYDITNRAYKIKVRGISLAPSLSITREAPKTELYVGEEARFSVTLKNTGGFARNVTYEESFPEQFEVASSEGAVMSPGKVVWKGALDESETASFSYSAKSNETFDGSLVASLTYFDGLRLKTMYSSKISLKASPGLVLLASVGDNAILVGEKDNLTVNMTNRLPETAVVSAEVAFDPGLKVASRPYGIKSVSPSSYVWNGELYKGNNKTINVSKALFFEFKGTKFGNSNIRVKVSYMLKSEAAARALPESKQSVVVSDRGVIVRTTFKDSTMEAGQYKALRAWVQNLNPYAAIKNVHLNMSTGITYVPNAFLETVEPQEQVMVVDKKFYAPDVDKSTGYVFVTNASYLTEFGENNSATFKDTATVSPKGEVSLSATPSAARVKAGEELEVTVVVRNSRLASLKNVYVADNVSDEWAVIGKNYATIEVRSKETVTAYNYKLKAPRVAKETLLHVNTTAKFSDKYASVAYENPADYILAKAAEITVEPESLPLTVTRTIDASTVYVGDTFYVTYKITNTAKDKVAKNMVLKVPLDYGLDLVGEEESAAVPLLNPGEVIAVANFDKRRAKVPGEVELSKPVLEYENVYGERYSVNGTATTLSVKDSYLYGPVILVERVVPQKANNTDFFDAKLKVRNIGTDSAVVLLDDGGKQFQVTVANKTEYVLNFTRKYATPGKAELQPAKARYAYGSVVYRTASKASQIEIADNPVIRVEKLAPAAVSNIDAYAVTLRVESRAPKPVENITVTDGERSWAVPSISAGGHANLSYQDLTKEAGTHKLKAASATYSYEGAVYTVQSNSPELDVEEKKLITVAKEVSPRSATMGEKVTVTLTAKNLHNDELEVIVIDNKKSFTVKLEPGGERNVSYESVADETTVEAASATYTINDQQLSAFTKRPVFELIALEGQEADKKAAATAAAAEEKGKGGILSRIAKALLGILMWRKGG